MPDLPVLTPIDERILGALMEKERTVPASYPLSLNGLKGACNQTSSRDPVVEYDDELLQNACRSLKDRGLLRIVWADRGPRTLKYHQTLSEVLELDDAERALLTVLLLRGPQAPGELKTRTDRLHGFADRHEVETVLAAMAARATPLVVEMPRRSGDRDARWTHLLDDRESPAAAEPTGPAGSAGPAIDLETRDERVVATYDAIAGSYAESHVDQLDDLPFERWLLERVAHDAGRGPIVDVGCGAGHITDYLATLGADASGIDVSSAMVTEARRRFPDGQYEVGDLRSLARPPAAAGWQAVLAWYSLIHLTPAELPDALAALVRPLVPGGWLIYAGHAGTGVRHVAEFGGIPIDVDLFAHEPAAVSAAFTAAGLVDVEWYRRSPITDLGESTERCYVLGRVPR